MARRPSADHDPSAETSELASRLRVATARLSRRLRQQSDTGLSPSQQSALTTIEGHGPVTLGDLAVIEHVTPPTVTKVVTRLEYDGLITRSVDPDDRRVSRVVITAEGRRRLQHSRLRRDAFLVQRLDDLDPHAVRQLQAAIDALEALAGVTRPATSQPEDAHAAAVMRP
jgi:DNA-binding MarR family transcriptional regulator